MKNMKKTSVRKFSTIVLSAFLAVIGCFAPVSSTLQNISPVTKVSAASTSSIDDILFDYRYYYYKYPDLQKAFGYNREKLYKHWIQYGMSEGRRPSIFYDPIYYQSTYADLDKVWHNDFVSLYRHFATYGIPEGRVGSEEFSVEIYKANYADLRNAFGVDCSNNWRYLKHYKEYGVNENRVTDVLLSDSTSASTTGRIAWVKTTNGTRLNIRSSPNTSSTIVGKLAYGESVVVFEDTGTGWLRIDQGYVSSQYITFDNPSASSASSASSSGNSSSVTYSKYTGVDYRLQTSDQKRIAALETAQAMATITWTAPVTFPTWLSSKGIYNVVTDISGQSSKAFEAGRTYVGIPYSMADHSFATAEWTKLITSSNLTTDNMSTTYYNFSNKTTAKGIDCSYLVYAALKSSNAGKISYCTTSQMLNGQCYKRLSDKSELKPADVLLKTGHCMLFVGRTSSGKYAVFEANASDSRVVYKEYTDSQIKAYSAYRFSGFSN
jgi:uncharacterized protein YgiM (DUF1202 family)